MAEVKRCQLPLLHEIPVDIPAMLKPLLFCSATCDFLKKCELFFRGPLCEQI